MQVGHAHAEKRRQTQQGKNKKRLYENAHAELQGRGDMRKTSKIDEMQTCSLIPSRSKYFCLHIELKQIESGDDNRLIIHKGHDFN
jgi:hypothetical protein